MKLAYMYATSEVAPAKVTAIQGDASACFARIRELGYEGVELLVRDPRAIDHALVERQLADAGLAMPAVCTGEVYGEDKLSLADPAPARRAETLERMIAAMDLAARFGASGAGWRAAQLCREAADTLDACVVPVDDLALPDLSTVEVRTARP